MEFFNDIGKKFSSVAKSVSEKTKDSVEVTRISSDLRGLKGDLEQLYTQLGKVCYAVRMGEGDADEAEQLAGRIQKTLARIEELTAQRDAIRDVRRCQSCGAVMPREARFCSNCGIGCPRMRRIPSPGWSRPSSARTAAPSAPAASGSARCAACPLRRPRPRRTKPRRLSRRWR